MSRSRKRHCAAAALLFVVLLGAGLVRATSGTGAWLMYAGDSQHAARSAVASQPLETIHWSTSVDLAQPPEPILVHYGSPLATPSNTVIVPVKTTTNGDFRIYARNGQDGSLIWSQTSDYVLP